MIGIAKQHSRATHVTRAELEQTQEFKEVIDTAQEVLIEVTSVFPFMIFPDTLKVDRQKVILIHRNFFGVAKIINIQIDDLQAIQVNVGPLFGSIAITTKQFSNTVNRINMLARKDAVAAQNMLEGFIIANQKGLNHTDIDKAKLIELLNNLGRTNNET